MSYGRHIGLVALTLLATGQAHAQTTPQATPVPTAGRVSYVSGTMFVQT